MMSTNDVKRIIYPLPAQPAGTDAPARQPYEAPKLISYGSLRELTQNYNDTGSDGTQGTGATA